LVEKACTTKRFKAFKTGIDDESMVTMADWFNALPAAGMPSEIHLSHNKASQDGFEILFNVLEEKRAELPVRPCPIWLRVESNSVPHDHVAALAEAGRVVFCNDIQTCRRSATTAVAAMPPLSASQWATTASAQSPAQVVRPPAQVSDYLLPPGTVPGSTVRAEPKQISDLLRRLQEKNASILAMKGKGGMRPQGPQIVMPPPPPGKGKGGPEVVTPPLAFGKGKGKVQERLAALIAMRNAVEKAKGKLLPPSQVNPNQLPPLFPGKGKRLPPLLAGKGQLPPSHMANAAPTTPPAEGEENQSDDEDSWGEWGKKSPEDAAADKRVEEKRIHPSDKSNTPYTFAGFKEFAKGDEAKAKKMWDESKVAQDATEQKKIEEKRIHPSDKSNTPYTFAGFKEFAKGDEAKAKRMWDESKVAQDSSNTSSHSETKDDKAWGSSPSPNQSDSRSWDQKSSNSWETKDDKNWNAADNNGGSKKEDNTWDNKKEVNGSWEKKDNIDEKSWGHKNDRSWSQEKPQPFSAWSSNAKEAKSEPVSVPSSKEPDAAKREKTQEEIDADEFERLVAEAEAEVENMSEEVEVGAYIDTTSDEASLKRSAGAHPDQPPAKVAAAAPSPGAAKADEEPLPPGWTKEWSEEYNIAFYWKEATEETTWVRPTA